MDTVCASGTSWLADRRSGDVPKTGDARNIIEALGNLFYLIQLDAENPSLVRNYTAQAEERLRALQILLPDSVLARGPNKGLKIVAVQGNVQPD